MNKQQYWLFKTEPSEYSYDDLVNNKSGGRWDGVRNYQARNYLRDSIKVGDFVLIYHSSIKVPAIHGVGKVKREAYPDPTQFDSNSPYYDAGSKKTSPRWTSLDIVAVKTLEKEVSLLEMRANPKLKDMVLLKKGSRLSIQPVTLQEFNEICLMAKR